jgi:tungstate transport system permease protein
VNEIGQALSIALELIRQGDPDLLEIVGLSLRVSLSALVLACLIGYPVGALLATLRFPGRGLVLIFLNTLMGLPPVVAGLLVYLVLSRAGPLGVLELLYTPSAMIIAQTLLITPIVAALTHQVIEDLYQEYRDLLKSLRASPWQRLTTLLWDARFSLLTAALAGFGRALAEVGAVMIVGGNINHYTRVMTSAITLSTAKGEFEFALALGIILFVLALLVNAALLSLRAQFTRWSHHHA